MKIMIKQNISIINMERFLKMNLLKNFLNNNIVMNFLLNIKIN